MLEPSSEYCASPFAISFCASLTGLRRRSTGHTTQCRVWSHPRPESRGCALVYEIGLHVLNLTAARSSVERGKQFKKNRTIPHYLFTDAPVNKSAVDRVSFAGAADHAEKRLTNRINGLSAPCLAFGPRIPNIATCGWLAKKQFNVDLQRAHELSPSFHGAAWQSFDKLYLSFMVFSKETA